MMAKGDFGAGERAERGRRWRFVAAFTTLALAGAVTGYAVAAMENGGSGFRSASIPAAAAVLLTILFLLTIGLGTWAMRRNLDEHALADNLWASTIAGSVYAVAYPAWFLLWKGRLVSEPDHLLLFILFLVTGGVAYLYKRVR